MQKNMENERNKMVQYQLARRGIRDPRVLQAMSIVPRHLFLPENLHKRAYEDSALPICDGQTISQPYIVALMAQALMLQEGDRVLEVGTGSGYAAAVMSTIVAQVYTIERSEVLADSARRRLDQLGYRNVEVVTADGTLGLPAEAPFDAISVAASAPWVPLPLRQQIGEGGRLVIPVGGPNEQVLLRLTRSGGEIRSEQLAGVRFVPLRGEHAWDEQHDH